MDPNPSAQQARQNLAATISETPKKLKLKRSCSAGVRAIRFILAWTSDHEKRFSRW